jgi:nucleoside-diphosphate-sugar epimerase
MKLLVTGASGFLGSHIAERLAKDGHQVRVLVRKTSSRQFLSGFPHEEALGDVTDAASLPAALAGVDGVIHAAGLVKARSQDEFHAVNAGGTASLLTAIREANPDLKRFVYISSLAAHGPSEDGAPRPLDATPNPITAYGRSKLAGEELTRASAVAPRAVIFRPPVIYGPRDPALVPFFRLARWRIAPLLAGGHNHISIIYVEDAARAIAEAATAEADTAGKTYCFDDGNVYSWRDLISAVEQSAGRRALRISAPLWAFTAAALASEAFGFVTGRAVSLTQDKVNELTQRYWVCSHEALKKDTGWSPRVDIWEGARLTGDWYRRHRWI